MNDRLSITEMKNMIRVYRELIKKQAQQLEREYRRGYIDGRRYNGTLLVDVAEKDLVLTK